MVGQQVYRAVLVGVRRAKNRGDDAISHQLVVGRSWLRCVLWDLGEGFGEANFAFAVHFFFVKCWGVSCHMSVRRHQLFSPPPVHPNDHMHGPSM
jgi:hypothetical protein